MKKLPIGRQTFSEVMETGYYVDKTNYIEMLTNIGTYFFLSRPRRFGKSTFLDTLKDAFEGKEKLFKGLYIGNRWDWSKKHPVIKISFGGGIMQSTEDVYNKIRGVLYFNQKHLDIQCHNTDPSNCLAELIQSSFEKYKEKVVLLIDEYDKPILDNIDNLEVALPVREILKGFYSVIKDSDEYIQFTFITGVSKFSKVNLFSGLNNLKDVTLDERFATICGYTHNELLDTFRNRLEGVPLDTLKSWYNGYNFLGEKVYNPFDVLLYLDSKQFKNYWFETGTPSFLIKLIENRKYHIPDLESVQLSENLLNSFDVDSIELETLLFQAGYLTIKNEFTFGQKKGYNLQYPNLEVKASLTDYILTYLSKSHQKKELAQQKLIQILSENNIDALKELFYSFFASIPYNWYTNNTIANYEGYYASIFYCYFAALGLEVKPEDTTNQGRIDMTVVYANRCFIFEFKVNELTEVGSAMIQLKEKKYHEKYVGYASTHVDSGTVKEIYLIGVEFSKTDKNITVFEWEKVN